ncbi:uncharacterized protein LOC127868684 [Dreissena polymorpha]|uniref:Uncharacterized protein n=1 Tax=Dreissena polymorpha TaxID=45954 RepID=A0A9D4M8Q7_DREPO|nr:uncharacterized protein LOC127868684 [Dreissena polymorpha]KAH3872198.1 hypothetical protein DPMN_035413 [Dreissena polymorpha]
MSDSGSATDSPKRGRREVLEKKARVIQEVEVANSEGKLLYGTARELVHALGQVHSSRLPQEKIQELIKWQYDIAVKQRKNRFVSELRYHADVICSKEFVAKAFGKAAAKKTCLGVSLNARQRGGTVRKTTGRPKIFSGLQSGFPALPATASRVPATVSLGAIKVEEASGDDEELPMETEVLSVIAPEEDQSTSSFFAALDEVGEFYVVDDVGQCEDTPLIKEGRAPVEGTPISVGASNAGVARVPVEAGNLAPLVIPTQVFTNSSYGVREPRKRSYPMREEPAESTPVVPECVPVWKILKPSVWTRLGSRMEEPMKKKRTSRCPLMGCTSDSRHLSRHVYQRHLPERFQLGNLANPAWQVARLRGLRWLALQLVGDDRLGTLLDFAQKNDLGINAEVSLSDVDRQWLSEFARQSGWPEVDFDIQRLNSQALLAHWRVLVGLLKHIPRDRQVYFFNLDSQRTSSTVPAAAGLHVQVPEVEHPSTPTPPVVAVTEPVRRGTAHAAAGLHVQIPEVEHPSTPTPPVGAVTDPVGRGTAHAVSNILNTSVREYLAVSGQANLSLARGSTSQASGRPVTTRISAFDSHFHLDRSLVKLGMPYYSDIRTILDADVGIRPQVEVDVVGGVLIYCDPETYPTSFPAQAGFGVAVGLHPRKAARFNPELYRHLKQLLRNERVVALGEVGLDRTEPADTWGLQEEVLTRILELSSPCQPIILHIRDGEDRQSGVLYLMCLELLKPNVARTQKVVLHCFTGAQEVVIRWCKAFPNCFFSYSGQARLFTEAQKQAVRRVPANRLLIETDSPYFRPAGARMCTPSFLGDVANVIASYRDSEVRDVCQLTLRNSTQLFGL